MNFTWLIIDVSCLAYRSFHVMPRLEFQGNPTEIVFSFLSQVKALQNSFNPTEILFCFDSKVSKRKKIYSQYKANRHKEKTEEEIKDYDRLYQQIDLLRTRYLKMIGFENIFHQPGYEADDLIASLVQRSISPKETAILASSDSDLHQLIRQNVLVYSVGKQRMLSEENVQRETGFTPDQVVLAKAMIGDPSDNLSGVQGIGKKRAIQYFQGTLSDSWMATIHRGRRTIKRNTYLTRLPFPGCRTLVIKDSQVNSRWELVNTELGFKRLGVKDKSP